MARPKIGGEAMIRFGDGLLRWVDLYAADNGVTRAAAIRAILTQFARAYARAHGRDGVDTIVGWKITHDPAAEAAPQ